MAYLRAEDIFFGYGDAPILCGASLSLRSGEGVALTGENGSGKTTLSLVLAGVLRPQRGVVEMDGVSPWGDDASFFRRRIGYVFQNPEDGFVGSDVLREIAFGAENAALPPKRLREKVFGLLELFELADVASRSPLQLSGGMKARLAVASALATDAEFIVLDEPESFLDARGVRHLVEAIREIRHTKGILHITQSPQIASLYDRTVALEGGRVVPGAVPSVAPRLRTIQTDPTDEILISLEGVTFAYDGDPVLRGVDFRIRRGEFLGLVGASGSGKTTLALLCAGVLRPSGGDVCRRCRVAVAMQFPERQLFAETVIGDVLYGPTSLGIPNAREAAEEALGLVGVDEGLWSRSPFELSDGQQRRVGIAGVLATKADLLIFDEPFAALDAKGVETFFSVLEGLARRRTSVVVITHRTELLPRFASRTVALAAGEVAFDGETEKLLHNPDLCDKVGIRPLAPRITAH